jgi:hypothetical protein
VYRYLATLKQVEIQALVNVERIKKYSPHTAVWLFYARSQEAQLD